jgi:hypothetical protein
MNAGCERWLPVDFMISPQMVSVRWIEFGDQCLTEPFFQWTLRRLRSRRPPAPERVTDLSTFLSIANEAPAVTPSGIIFHVSRCGSTLVANALRTADRIAIISEAGPFGKFFGPQTFRNSPFPVDGWDEARRMFLDSLTRLYARHAAQMDSRIVLKCHAASILWISLVRRVWPDVPFLIIIRDPVEVMMSNLLGPSGWMRARYVSLEGRTLFGWSGIDVQNMPAEEYCARGVGRFCDAARRQIDEKCRVIDYSDLNRSNISKISKFFNISLPIDSEEFTQVFETYAKDPKRMRPHQDDRAGKQREASDLVKQAARRWAQEPYGKLKQSALW